MGSKGKTMMPLRSAAGLKERASIRMKRLLSLKPDSRLRQTLATSGPRLIRGSIDLDPPTPPLKPYRRRFRGEPAPPEENDLPRYGHWRGRRPGRILPPLT